MYTVPVRDGHRFSGSTGDPQNPGGFFRFRFSLVQHWNFQFNMCKWQLILDQMLCLFPCAQWF